ncbi:response regulator [Piscirickettsia litoralis]|uniref:Response regulatory domain-containing protein n=1 Tax=Piscirickettsia litoralis TaxID=1891921 RepID=A0ABX3A8C8_9GAMM|nr:response regulator [Piscirickettsia litoralis]ODN43690.1 hypothetical protein BGC07_13250 [Piscirickettsia litoralis]
MKILIVDDRKNILFSLKRLILLKFPESTFKLAQSGEEAIALIDAENFDFIISDYKMGKIDGVQVLAHAHQTQENSIRVLITGYPNNDQLIDAIAANDVEHVLMKPWTQEQIMKIIAKYPKQPLAPSSSKNEPEADAHTEFMNDAGSLSNANDIVHLLKEATKYLSLSANYLMKIYDIPSYSPQFLIPLWDKDGMTQQELSTKLKLNKKIIMNALIKLIEDGLVTIDSSKTEKNISVYLTEKGLKIKDDLDFLSAILNRHAINEFKDSEQETLKNLLTKLIFNLSTIKNSNLPKR